MKKKKNSPYSVAIGHQSHDQGCGRHQDRRNRRQRTRQAIKAAALKEWK
ncbi:MAG: hypothetical protein ACO4CS_14625 [bacterium]